MSQEYRHTQLGTVTLVAAGLGVAVLVAGACVSIPRWLAVPPIGLVVAIGLVFGTLTIEVAGGVLRATFGLGVPAKRVPVAEIASAEAVRNRWWYGWGIRWTLRGWLYNVAGLGAVEIVLRNGRRFRLGTDEPEALRDAIGAAGRAAAAS
ncbi:MAG: hypothetical protein ACREID_06595 [Planctomycetota bacterium]